MLACGRAAGCDADIGLDSCTIETRENRRGVVADENGRGRQALSVRRTERHCRSAFQADGGRGETDAILFVTVHALVGESGSSKQPKG